MLPAPSVPGRGARRWPAAARVVLILGLLVGSAAAPGTAQTPAQTPARTPLARQLEQQAEEFYARDDLAGAVDLYVRASEATRDRRESARLLIAGAWLEFLDADRPGARDLLVQALESDPDYPFEAGLYGHEFVTIWQEARQDHAAATERELARWVHRGVGELEAGRLEEARRWLELAEERRPEDPTVLYDLALIDIREGLRDSAMTRLQKLDSLALAPRPRGGLDDEGAFIPPNLHAMALNQLALLFLGRGDLGEAESLLERAVATDGFNAAAWNNLGSARLRNGRTEAAAEAFGRAVELEPGDLEFLLNLGRALSASGRHDEAVSRLRPAAEAHPDRADVWLTLAQVRLDGGEADAAVGDLEQALGRLEDTELGAAEGASRQAVEAWSLLTRAYWETRRWQDAVSAAARALELAPDSGQVWLYRGLALKQLGDPEQSLESLRRASELLPRRADVANNFGSALYARGDLERAATEFRRALALEPELEAARRNLELTEQALAAGHGERSRPGASRPPEARTPPSPASEAPAPQRRIEPVEPPTDPPARQAQPSTGDPVDAGWDLVLESGRHPATGLDAVRVVSVGDAGLARRVGLRTGDWILRIDGDRLEDPAFLLRELERLATSGRTLTLDLFRGDQAMRLPISRP